jgi:hypothetical protein
VKTELLASRGQIILVDEDMFDETAVKLFGEYAKINITQEKNNV